jgi:TRAP-type C4-dicarboxylate transport system substrate-binding protein
MEFTISMNKWKELPDNLKAALQGAYEDYYTASISLYKKELATVDELIKQKKVIVSEIDKPCKESFEKIARKIWDDQAKKDPDSAKAIEIIKKWNDKNKK